MIYNEKGVAQMSKINNQKYIKLFQTVCEATINAPKEAFNLHDWVFTLSDKDYQTTARGHIGAGSSIHTDGTQCVNHTKYLLDDYLFHLSIQYSNSLQF